MTTKNTVWISLMIIAISIILGLFLYPSMPDRVASHWGADGNVNGYMSKFWGLFLMPIISLAMLGMFLIIPKLDPMKANIEKFRRYFNNFIVLMMVFLFYLYLLTIAWNKDYKFDMVLCLIPAFTFLFYYIGVMIENSERNWFIGIRTPWTISSDVVWAKTHKLGGKLFKACGIIALLGLVWIKIAFWFLFVPVITASIWTVVYSYLEYKKLNLK